jgi:D-glycero-D-manno-heptose 1,7-bisphosphate phosphatase
VSGRAAVFLDRDGVLNELVADPRSHAMESPLRREHVSLIPGAAAAAARLARAGYALVCVTNQPAAAKGTASVEQLYEVHERVLELLDREGVSLDASRLCPHHPQGVLPALSGPCACRKPAPGMLLDVAAALELDLHASWMVGDTDVDVLAGARAGCGTALLLHPHSAHKRSGRVVPDFVDVDLHGAVDRLLDERDAHPGMSSAPLTAHREPSSTARRGSAQIVKRTTT